VGKTPKRQLRHAEIAARYRAYLASQSDDELLKELRYMRWCGEGYKGLWEREKEERERTNVLADSLLKEVRFLRAVLGRFVGVRPEDAGFEGGEGPNHIAEWDDISQVDLL